MAAASPSMGPLTTLTNDPKMKTMAGGASGRHAADIAELDSSAHELPGGGDGTTESNHLLENAEPRRWPEVCLVILVSMFLGFIFVPYSLKKGQVWYVVAHSVTLGGVAASVFFLFWGNTHAKLIRFLCMKKVFWQVCVLMLVDWMRVMAMPDVGWELTDRIAATTTLVFRLHFFCCDSLRGMSRFYRIFSAACFFIGNFWTVFASYFLDEAQPMFFIEATNTSVTTADVKASVGTTMSTLTLAMMVTIVKDPAFQYSAFYYGNLPKLAVESAGVEPGSQEMHRIVEAREGQIVAWRGWPCASTWPIICSIVLFYFSLVVSGTTPDGKESLAMIVLRIAALTLASTGSCCFFRNNINWRRLKYTVSSTQGVLWTFYTLVFFWAGMAAPDPDAPVSSMLGIIYTTLGLLSWVCLEAVQQISRVMHITVTVHITAMLAFTIYLSAFVWQNDAVLADPNGVGVPGQVTRFRMMRTCFINLLFLMASALWTSVRRNLSEAKYFVLVSGNVLRREILDVESLTTNLEGDNDRVVNRSYKKRFTRHSVCLTT